MVELYEHGSDEQAVLALSRTIVASVRRFTQLPLDSPTIVRTRSVAAVFDHTPLVLRVLEQVSRRVDWTRNAVYLAEDPLSALAPAVGDANIGTVPSENDLPTVRSLDHYAGALVPPPTASPLFDIAVYEPGPNGSIGCIGPDSPLAFTERAVDSISRRDPSRLGLSLRSLQSTRQIYLLVSGDSARREFQLAMFSATHSPLSTLLRDPATQVTVFRVLPSQLH